MYDFSKDYCYTNKIKIEEIIFDDESNDVTLLASLVNFHTHAIERGSLGCQFSMLNDILFYTFKEAEPVIDKINERLQASYNDMPIRIDVRNILGNCLLISGLKFKLFKPQLQKKGENIFIIEAIETKNSKSKPISKKMEYELVQTAIAELTVLLHTSYYHYCYYKAKGRGEEFARTKAGLCDVRLFRLAKLYYRYSYLQDEMKKGKNKK